MIEMSNIIISENLKLCAWSFYIFIGILTVGGMIANSVKKGKSSDTFLKRMISLWVLIVLFTFALSINTVIGFIFFAILSFLGLREYFTMIQIKYGKIVNNPFIYLTIPIQFYIMYKCDINLFYIFIPLIMFIVIPVFKTLHGKDEKVGENSTIIHLGLMLTVYGLGYMSAFLLIPQNSNIDGVALITYILILTLMNDFFQAVFGTFIGKHKIIPAVSPNKSWEGFIGGITATGILSLIMGIYLTPFGKIELFFIGIVLGAFGFLGDVLISAIKRDIGVKDSGTLLPGHGGFLDRFDSIIFTAPLFFHYVVFTQKPF